jgi:hypothetical protein
MLMDCIQSKIGKSGKMTIDICKLIPTVIKMNKENETYQDLCGKCGRPPRHYDESCLEC